MNYCTLISLLFVAAWTGKCGGDQTAPSNMIVIEDGSKPFKAMMKLRNDHWTMRIYIKENTLNDTAKIHSYGLKIAPGQTGLIEKQDCHLDSMPLFYYPYKATGGRLVLTYTTSSYW
ncbi:MAG: hypothetical protein SFV22_07175 [Saprospiraceae bacterium]|nr:hypothetical protein [Saprospiraceae bacterium]